MRTNLLSCLCLVTLLSCARVQGELQQLYWKNGDVLTGTLIDADKEGLRWKSPDFTVPFDLSLDALRLVRVPRNEQFAKTKETCQAVLRTGDVIYGNLELIDKDTIRLLSQRHGLVSLDRATVRSLRSLKNDALIYAGPTSIDEWETIRHGKAQTDNWQIDSDGRLATATRDAAVFNAFDIPNLAQIELILRWTKDPAFMLSLFKPAGNKVDSSSLSFLIDTWDDEVVLETEEDFEPLVTLDDNRKELLIRLYWDRIIGELSVYSADGTHITTMKNVKGNAKLATGIYLRNKGANLSIGDVRVGKWNGNTPQPVKKGQSRLHLSDGNIIYGEIKNFGEKDGIITIIRDGQDDDQTLANVDSIYFEDDEREWEIQGHVNLSYFDGERMSGEIVEIRDNMAKLKTLYSKQPIDCKMDGIRHFRVETDAAATPENLSLLEYDGGRIHGRFAGGTTADTAIAWVPVGSKNASPLARSSNARVVRATPGRKLSPNDELIDVLFLRNRDVLPCRIHAITEDTIHIKTGFGEKEKIDASQVKAIELASDSEIQITGFASDRWKFQPDDEESFERSDKRVTFNTSGTFAHATILRGNELRFDATWNKSSVSQLDLRLFSDDVMRQDSPEVGVQITFSANQLIIGPPQVRNARVRRRLGRPNTVAANGKATIRIVVDQNKLRAYVAEQLVYSSDLNRDNQNGRGLGFHLKSYGRNQPKGKLLTISNFEIRRSTNAKRVSPRINPLKKQTVLTNPRMYRDKAPSHIIIGRNGDLLRGRLTTLSRDRIHFISRMDDLSIPRSRVSAMVWLHKDELDKQAQPPKEISNDRVRLVFVGGSTISITPTSFEDNRLNGMSSVLGKCSIPIDFLSEIHVGNYVKIEPKVAYGDWSMTAAPEPKFAAGSSSGGQQNGPSFGKDSNLVGTVPDDFELATLDGKNFRLSEQRGKIVVLDFWASWCPPCIRGLPEIMAAVKSFDKDKVVLCGVNLQEAKVDVQQFLENREWALNTALDLEGAIAEQFDVKTIPQTIVVDKDGTIQFAHIGGHPEMKDQITKAIQALLDGKTEVAAENEPAEIVGKTFSDLELSLLNDEAYKIGDRKGKVIVLDFWATWCEPCITALPEISKVVDTHKDRVELVAVNQMDPTADVKAFVEKNGWKFNIALDLEGEIGEKFKVENLPKTIIIGPDGKVEYVKSGYNSGDEQKLADQINKLVGPQGEGPKRD